LHEQYFSQDSLCIVVGVDSADGHLVVAIVMSAADLSGLGSPMKSS